METTYDAPEDDPITGAVLEICEIEVHGMFIKFLNSFMCSIILQEANWSHLRKGWGIFESE